MLFDFICQFLELVLEIFPIQHYFLVLVTELVELFAHPMNLFFDGAQLALVVFPAHFVLLELPEEGLQLVSFESISFEGIFQLVVGISQLKDLLFVFLGLLVNFLDLVSVLFDELDVVPGNFVVVVFQLGKCIFVIFHQLIDVQILPFLELVDVYPQPELQFLLHFGEFDLVALLHVHEFALLLLDHNLLLALVVLLDGLCFFDVVFLLLDSIFLEVLLLLLHVLHPVLVVLVFLDFALLAVFFDIHVGFFLLVLQKFQFLEKDLDLGVVVLLHVLSFGLLVEDLGVHLVDFYLGVVIELLDHISVHLNVVPLGFHIAHLLLVELQIALQLWSYHLYEFVVGLLFLLWTLRTHLHTNIFITYQPLLSIILPHFLYCPLPSPNTIFMNKSMFERGKRSSREKGVIDRSKTKKVVTYPRSFNG